MQYFQGWNIVDFLNILLFTIVYILDHFIENEPPLYMYILTLMNVSLAFIKLLFFIRLFEDFGFLVQLLISCLKELIPFFILYIIFLLFFAMCFEVLRVDVDGEIEQTPALTHFQLILLGVYRTALGELSMPGY